MSELEEYEKLLANIAALQARADEMRSSRRVEAIKTVNQLVDEFGILPREVRFSDGRGSKPSASDGRSKVAARYADGQGNSWSGRGKQPRWLQSGIASGRSLESYRIASAGGK